MNSNGIANGVRLDGWVEHSRLAERLIRSDVLAFPSIREFGGAVVLEAMALGLAPLVVNYGGPAELVTRETGRLVPMGTRAEIVTDLRMALEEFVAQPTAVRAMGDRARKRVFEYYTWDAKARQMREVFAWVLGEREDKPDFGLPLTRTPPM